MCKLHAFVAWLEAAWHRSTGGNGELGGDRSSTLIDPFVRTTSGKIELDDSLTKTLFLWSIYTLADRDGGVDVHASFP